MSEFTNHPPEKLVQNPHIFTYVFDGFNDDIMTIVVGEDAEMIKRAQGAVPVALHAIFQPLQSDEPTLRNDILSL